MWDDLPPVIPLKEGNIMEFIVQIIPLLTVIATLTLIYRALKKRQISQLIKDREEFKAEIKNEIFEELKNKEND